MASPEPLDYKKSKLYINGLEVVDLTMVGLLAERIPNLVREKKRVGLAASSAADLPDHLVVFLNSTPPPQTPLNA